MEVAAAAAFIQRGLQALRFAAGDFASEEAVGQGSVGDDGHAALRAPGAVRLVFLARQRRTASPGVAKLAGPTNSWG